MRMPIALALLASVQIFPHAAKADIRFEGGGGLAIPVAPEATRRSWSLGPDFTLGASFDAGQAIEGALLADVSSYALKQSSFGGGSQVSGGRMTLVSVTANMRLFTTQAYGAVRPFMSAGVGFLYMNVGELRAKSGHLTVQVPESNNSGVAQISLGAGVRLQFSKSIESMVQVHLLESVSPAHGMTSRNLVIRLLFRPVKRAQPGA